MPDAPAASAEALVAAFEQRILTRDEPVPLSFDADSIKARLRAALRTRLRQEEPRRLTKLVHLCYEFLASPTQRSLSPALLAALGCSGDALAKVWLELLNAGLVTYQREGHGRRYRLTRDAEDWLLAVVKGEAS